jgi:DNA-binding CsgD family transcriptional regulator
MDSLQKDLEAVLGALHLDRFILMGSHASSHAAVRYAIGNPGRVDALVLGPCGASGRAWSLVSALDLARRNWDFFLATWTVSGDHASPEEARLGLVTLKQCMTQQDWEIMATAWVASDIEELLPTLSTPTLLLHPRDYLNVPLEASIRLGSQIAGARLALIDGKSPLGDAGQGLAAIEAFLKDVLPIAEQGQPAAVGGVRTSSLTRRQLEVLVLVAQGKTNREIADALVLSERTVQRHISDIYLKIDVRNRAEAVGFARDHAAQVLA